MTYEEKEDSREVILVGYYNVLFYLIFRVGLDEYKKDILIERIRSGERMVMKDIYRWCEGHQVPFWTKFIYRIFLLRQTCGICIHIAVSYMKLGEPIIIWIIKSKGTVDKRLDRDKDNPSAAKKETISPLE